MQTKKIRFFVTLFLAFCVVSAGTAVVQATGGAWAYDKVLNPKK